MGETDFITWEERNLAHFLSLELKRAISSWSGRGGTKAISMALQTDYDLIFTECSSGGYDGPGFCREAKSDKPASVIMVLDHREELQDQIETIQRFAVSYIYKPVIIDQLVARISAIFRGRDFIDQHCSQMKGPNVLPQFAYGCRTSHTVYRGEEMIALTRREYDLLATLMGSKKVLTREQLLESVWKYESATETNIVDVYIRYLRSKLDVKGQKATLKPCVVLGTPCKNRKGVAVGNCFFEKFLYIDIHKVFATISYGGKI